MFPSTRTGTRDHYDYRMTSIHALTLVPFTALPDTRSGGFYVSRLEDIHFNEARVFLSGRATR